MRRSRLYWAVALLAGLSVGCSEESGGGGKDAGGGSGGGEASALLGTCDRSTAEGTWDCVEYRGSYWDASQVKKACEAGEGNTWTSAPCPTGWTGCCIVGQGTPGENRQCFYPPFHDDNASVDTRCKGFPTEYASP